MSQIKYWVWLSSLHALTVETVKELLIRFENPEAVYFASRQEYQGVSGIKDAEIQMLLNKNLDETNRILESCGKEDVSILTIQDAPYPVRLKSIYNPPLVLYMKGRLPVVDEEVTLAVVGTRKASPYGRKTAKKIAYEIAKGGGLVVTGLAEGIDSAAAAGALYAGRSVIGVLGNGVDVYYPAFNRALYDDVAAAGALLSEYPPGTRPLPAHFPLRNRIMSGISLGVLVVEAPYRSGSLITASRALDQGRDVFVVPGNIDTPSFCGGNELVKDGAALVTGAEDILREYRGRFPEKLLKQASPLRQVFEEAGKTELSAKSSAFSSKKGIDNENSLAYIDLKAQLADLSEDELSVIGVMPGEPEHVDEIIELSKLPADKVLAALTMLEIKGLVRQEAGKRFSLIINKK